MANPAGTSPERSNAANLFTLPKQNYVSLKDMACVGNPNADRDRNQDAYTHQHANVAAYPDANLYANSHQYADPADANADLYADANLYANTYPLWLYR